MSHKIFDNNLVAIRKSKLALKLNKLAYIGMCILQLTKMLMYKFHYDYIKNKYDNSSKLSFTDTDSLMNPPIKILAVIKKMFEFSNCSINLKYYDNLNKLVIRK